MNDENKKAAVDDDSRQLGDKDENPSMDKTFKNAQIAWTPGEQRPMVANIFTESGITKFVSPRPKQGAPVQKPVYNRDNYNNSGPSSL